MIKGVALQVCGSVEKLRPASCSDNDFFIMFDCSVFILTIVKE